MRINFAGEAIDVLGGNIAVGRLFGLDYRVVLNWRTRGFPPDTYAVLAPALPEVEAPEPTVEEL